MRQGLATLLALGLAATAAAAHEAPSVPRVDAPELAQLGGFAVGVSTTELVDPARNDRRLEVDLWYPAAAAAGAAPETYRGSLTAEPPAASGRPTSAERPRH